MVKSIDWNDCLNKQLSRAILPSPAKKKAKEKKKNFTIIKVDSI